MVRRATTAYKIEQNAGSGGGNNTLQNNLSDEVTTDVDLTLADVGNLVYGRYPATASDLPESWGIYDNDTQLFRVSSAAIYTELPYVMNNGVQSYQIKFDGNDWELRDESGAKEILYYDTSQKVTRSDVALAVGNYTTANLPDPTLYKGAIAFDTTLNKHVGSDGTTWNQLY